MKVYIDKLMGGRVRDKDTSSDTDGGSLPPEFNTWEEYVTWLVNNNFPLPDQFNSWEEFIDWLINNNYSVPGGYDTWEEYIQYLIDQSFPLPNNFNTWQEFIDWLTTNNFNVPDGFNTWEEYVTWLINNNYPLPDEFASWEEFIQWLIDNNYSIPGGYDTWEEYIQYLIDQSFPLPNNFNTWQEFIDWLTNNNFEVPDGFNTWQDYIDWYISNHFPLPDQFNTWQEFIDWISQNTYPDNFNSWEEYIEYLIDQNNGKDTGTYLVSGSITWKSGLTFTCTNLVYKILGEPFSASAREITLEPAGPTNPRIDIFVADRFGNVFAVTGETSADPVKPTVQYDQLEVTQANIGAGAVQPSGLDIQTIYDELDPEEWTPSAVSDDDIATLVNDTVDPHSGTKYISVSIDIPDETGNSPLHYIGEEYQGGVIFYVDPSGKKGLIASKFDQSGAAPYQYSPHVNGTENNIDVFFGKVNTAVMMGIANSNQPGMAAPLCVNYRGGGFSDWHLPSRNELNLMRYYRNHIGGFANTRYWSSTEAQTGSDSEAYGIDFSLNSGYFKDQKGAKLRVRAIRQFDDTQQSFTEPVTDYSPINTTVKFLSPTTQKIKNGVLTFWLKSSKNWLADTALLIESWKGGVKSGGTLLQSLNFYGFNSNNSEYQQVAIPVSNFGVNVSEVTAFTFRLINTWPNGVVLNIDLVRLQTNTEQQIPTGALEDISFEYRDVSELGQVYTLDLSASFDYKVVGLIAKSDAGTLTATIKINGVAVTGLAAEITPAIQKFAATGAELVKPDDLVTLEITAHDTAAELIGKLQISRI